MFGGWLTAPSDSVHALLGVAASAISSLFSVASGGRAVGFKDGGAGARASVLRRAGGRAFHHR